MEALTAAKGPLPQDEQGRLTALAETEIVGSADEGKVWANDQQAQQARVLGPGGTAQPVEKAGPADLAEPDGEPEGDAPDAPAGDAPDEPTAEAPDEPTGEPEGDAPDEAAAEEAPAPQEPAAAAPGEPAGAAAADPAPAPTATLAPSSAPSSPAAPNPSPSPPPAVAVPDVVGRDRDDACDRVRAAGLNCEQQGVGPGAGRPGQVVATVPAPDTAVAPGTRVLVQHLGEVTTPDLAGRPVAEACAIVESADLVCGRQVSATPATAATQVGVVAEQAPLAGSPIAAGATVTVRYPEAVTVPDVRTLAQADACAALQTAGFACVPQPQGPATAATPAPLVVYEQSPAPGTAAGPGTSVGVLHHGNPVVPAVAGAGLDAACQAVTAAGLVCSPTLQPHMTPGVAFEQVPAAGTEAALGSAVQVLYWPVAQQEILRYRRGEDPVWVPRGNNDTGGLDNYQGAGSVGRSGIPVAGTEGFFAAISAYQCTGRSVCGYDINHYLTTGGAPSGAPWELTGTPAWVFTQQWPGTQPLHRLQRVQGNQYAWAYATPADGAWNDYQAVGFVPQEILGYVWPG